MRALLGFVLVLALVVGWLLYTLTEEVTDEGLVRIRPKFAYVEVPTTTSTTVPSPTVVVIKKPPSVRTASVGARAIVGDPPDSDFDRLAVCESGGRWDLNTGNGYFGGLQFSASTWRAYGGTGFAHEHPRETQIEIARRLWRARGWQPWPVCSRRVGLR